ncbi:dihydrofolate reductase family protein [Luteimonas sp. SX5]|uniref:Dihydrofolate reductase family protein n=1 Tax=Luteimonas galliterrae TaxID=2940486 RepID=A0ABT0MJN7_9GAMM|nr:dihydrofolate reductase family protein [Luteimonas galliterrae]MCL1635085.1 dihydrofolate reductase family protein [Luteimonas galliterrae]
MDRLNISHHHPVYGLKPGAHPSYEPRKRHGHIQMRRLKYHATASVDGFVLDDPRDLERFGAAAMQQHRAIEGSGIAVMGRGTYRAMREYMAKAGHSMTAFVFSRGWRTQDLGVEWISESAQEWVRRIKICPGKDLHLFGGRRLADSLFRAGLIDEVVLRVVPVLQGIGERPLPQIKRDFELVRNASAVYEDGSVALTYRTASDRPVVAAAIGDSELVTPAKADVRL